MKNKTLPVILASFTLALSVVSLNIVSKDNYKKEVEVAQAVGKSSYWSSWISSHSSELSSGGTSLVTALKQKITQAADGSSNTISYNGLWDAYKTSDSVPGTNGSYIWDMYGGYKYAYQSGGKSYSKEGDCYNREHSVPKSWFSEKTPAYSDLIHLVPTDGKVNGMRSNYAFGEVSSASYSHSFSAQSSGGTQYQSAGISKLGSPKTINGVSSGKSIVFEPDDQYKGDFARIYMYFAVRFGGGTCSAVTGDGGAIFTNTLSNSNPYMTNYGLALMQKWHVQDPVSTKETNRNDAVETLQGNRNPFVDYPEWADKIFGTNYSGGSSSDPAVTSVSISPAAVTLNISNGQASTILTPIVSVINGASQTVTWTVSPTNQGVTVNSSGVVTAAANASTGNYTVTATSTYDSTKYGTCAVTVSNTSGGGGGEQTGDSETITMSEQGFTDGATVETVNGDNCTITFAKSTGSNPPKYYNTGSSVRAYPNNTITVASEQTIIGIELTFGSGDNSNEITVSPGTFESPNWTGSANSVTFTIGGSNGHRRIAAISVTFEGSSSTATLSSIGVETDPDKTVYFEGDCFDPSGLVITRNYSDSSSDTYSYDGHESEFTFSPSLSTPLTGDDEEIVVTYGGETAYISIDIGSVYLDSISVQTAPTKTTYFEGDNFDPTGLVITRNYNNDTSDTYTYAGHENKFSFSPSTSTSLTTSHTQVTITYEGESTTQSITVNAVALSSIEVSTAPTKTTYTAGEYFDPTGLVITRNYNNGSSSTYTYAGHTSEFTFSPSTSTALTTSHTSVTITYGNKSTTQTITVNSSGGGGGSGESGSQRISASNSSSYYQSGDICPTGNTTSASASCDAFEVSWLKNNSTNNIAYSYDEMRVYGGHSFTITPKEGYTISTIVITANSSSYASAVGGGSVNNCTITVNNSTVTLNPTNGANAVGFTNSAQSRLNYVVVNYEYQSSGSGDKTLTSITLNTENAQTKYMVGDDFSIDDVIVTAHYDDSSSAVVDTPLTFSGYNMNVSNVYEITVSYTENEVTKSASYYITVYERFITAVVSGYVYVGEKLTKDKITVTDSADRVITDFEFDSINYQFTYADAISGQSYTAKTFTNSITYDDLTCSLTVLVKRAAYDTGSPQNLTVTYTDLPTSYQTTTDERTAASGVKFIAYNCANYSSKMQFKASGGYFQTTEAMTLTQLTINNRETNALTISASIDGSNFTNISGTNDVYNLTGYYYLKVIKNGSGAAYCSSLTITISNAATAKNVANYIMYEDTNNQCLTKLDVALSYLSTLSETELNTFTTSTDYVISSARARLEAWAASQKKTIHYEVNNVTASAPNNLVNKEINSMSSTTITIIVISISASVLACGYFILKKKKLD